MGLDVGVKGNIRGAGQPTSNVDGLSTNLRGETLIALGSPGQTEWVRYGESYAVIQGTAVAPVVALPTTAAQVSIWNGEPDGGKSYSVDSLIAMVAVSASASSAIGFAAMMNQGRVALPSGSLLTPHGLSGRPYGGQGKVVLAATSLTDDAWMPVGNSVVGAASQIAMPVEVTVGGLYLVRPGHLFSIAVLANTASTITVKMGFRWHEVQTGVA